MKKGRYLLSLLLVFTAIGVAIYMGTGEIMTNEMKSNVDGKKSNRLINEKSPYLLQHAYNPVNWFPWGEEAFEKAKRENKPIFLSIGYSTCHWCHVMEHESFNDPEVARLMNEAFVSIKVDREERPDIDGIYMEVCQMISGNCGWPLNILMTPDKKPFFAASYIPKTNRFGRVGMMDFIPKVKEAWASKRSDIINSADSITNSLSQNSQDAPGGELGEPSLKLAFEQLAGSYDEQYGGFRSAPKFPTPHNFLFLLRHWKRTGEKRALEMVEKTLTKIRLGGIYDHIGLGVHRYSTDDRWLVPHFEKMLYDQAMLSIAYTETYQATGKDLYRTTAEEIFSYIKREMTSRDGAFFTAEDADSEGEEGKFYVWHEEEIRKVLGASEAELIIKLFNVEKGGNFIDGVSGEKPGENILHLGKTPDMLAADLNIPQEKLEKSIENAREKLFQYRKKRPHPYKDDKVLTDWNGLMIAALSKGAQAFDRPEYAEAAARAARFILEKMRTKDGRLLHRYRDGNAAIDAHVDDYAFFIWGLLELYQATFDVDYLKSALELNRDMLKHFWDDKNGGFYSTADDGEELLVRQKEIYDGAIPSGNSVAMSNLIKLGRLTADSDLEELAAILGKTFSGKVGKAPAGYTQLMAAVDFAVGPSFEVVVAGDSRRSDTKEMLKALMAGFVPNKVVLLRPTEKKSPEITRIADYTRYNDSIDGKATAYVCQNFNCTLPTTDIDKMMELLGHKRTI